MYSVVYYFLVKFKKSGCDTDIYSKGIYLLGIGFRMTLEPTPSEDLRIPMLAIAARQGNKAEGEPIISWSASVEFTFRGLGGRLGALISPR